MAGAIAGMRRGMSATSETVRTADGWLLRAEVYAADAPRGTVLLLHAMMVDRRTFLRGGGWLRDVMNEAGFHVIVADFRGHGESGPKPEAGGTWDYDDLVLRDVPALVGFAKTRFNLPVSIIGHSLGGHVAAASLGVGATQASALVGIAANVWIAALEPSRRVRLGRRAAMVGMKAFARWYGVFPSRKAGIGTADEARPYVRDLARFEHGWTSRDGARDYLDAMKELGCPSLFLTASGDRFMAPSAYAARWARTAVGAEIWPVDDGVHGGVGRPGHMDLVTDPGQAPVWRGIADWLLGATVDNQVQLGELRPDQQEVPC